MLKRKNVCSLESDEREKRIQEIAELASSALIAASRTSEGAWLRLENTPATKVELERLIEAESKCCSFLRFQLEVGEELSLDVKGPADARPLIDQLFTLDFAGPGR